MKSKDHRITCGMCGALLTELSDTPFELRKPCPNCGSRSRRFDVLIQGEFNIRSKLRIKSKRGGKGKPFFELFKGFDFFRKRREWMMLTRIIDRENDRYIEKITNPNTGEIDHMCEEPLSKHTGHRSARSKF